MDRIAPYGGTAPGDIVKKLEAIQPGESVTYHTGVCLDGCPEYIRWRVDKLLAAKRITVVQKRVALPMNGEGKLDTKKGVGKFDYIAQGLKIS
jgi:hypothetical protein